MPKYLPDFLTRNIKNFKIVKVYELILTMQDFPIPLEALVHHEKTG